MDGLKTDLAPSQNVVIPHFIYSTFSFLAFAIMLVISSDSLAGHYFQPSLLAMTHVAVLGWATMIIFGALYQLIPVIMEAALFSETLARINFWILAIGIAFLAISLWLFSYELLMPIASIIVLLGFLLFSLNITITSIKADKKEIQTWFIGAASIWLFLTGLLGTLIVFNYRFNFFDQIHLHYLKIHAHLGMAGWFILLIMGVSSLLLPMFFISHKLNKKKMILAFFLINTGLIALSLDWWFTGGTKLIPAYGVIISGGILSFISFIYDSYKKRMRKKLDIGMKFSVLSIILFFAPIVLGFMASLKFPHSMQLLNRISLLYGFVFIIGFIGSMILGQIYKTLPFIIWLDKYKDRIGKEKTIMPRELYSERMASVQFWAYVPAIVLLATGILISNKLILYMGSIFLLVCTLAYVWNVFMMFLHKPKDLKNS